MFCISCGKKIPDGMGFCPYCGAAQHGGGQSAPAPSPAPTPSPTPTPSPAPASSPSPAPAPTPAPTPNPATTSGPASAPNPSASPAPAASAPSPAALVPNVDDKRLGQIACVLSAVVAGLELAGLHQVCLAIGAVCAVWLLVNIVKK